MRILVISDTHIPAATDKLPSILEKEAGMSDYCIHSGDFTSMGILNEIANWTKIYGVCGNMDDPEIRKKLPEKQVIEIEKIKIGLIHGAGNPSGLIDYVNKEFSRQLSEIDIFIFGHSHFPLNEKKDGKIYFNAGSPTDKMFAPYRSYGILEIEGKKIEGRIVKIG